MSSEERSSPVRGQAVNQSAEMRSALEFFETAYSFPERSLESVNCTGFEDTLNILAALVLSCTPSAEKYVHMVSSMESRLGPSTQDKAERLMATTGHFFEHAMTAYLPPGFAGERRIFADTSRVEAGCP